MNDQPPATPVTNHASERIQRLGPKIMKTWELRANDEVAAALHQESLALRNSLPQFLELLSSALSSTIDRTQVRIRRDRAENLRIGKKHGKERAAMLHYTMDQVIFEYHILRQVICETMEEEAPLTDIEREVIICGVEQAVNDAATEFSHTFREVHESMTNALAHDLRGPLTRAKLSAQLLMRKTTDAYSIQAAEKISHAMDRLDTMIMDLLDASRLRAGESLTLNLKPFDLQKTLEQVTDDMNFLHDNRIDFKSIGPVIGKWNESGIRRVIDNLLTNAIKFSAPNTRVTVSLLTTEAAAEITVHNNGEVIQPDQLPLIFEPFQRTQAAESKTGWGIGLTVVKGITEAHGGKVSVTSLAGAGTSFKVVLPFKNDQ